MTSCTKQTFMAEITRLQREVEGLTKTRELQEAERQRLKNKVTSLEQLLSGKHPGATWEAWQDVTISELHDAKEEVSLLRQALKEAEWGTELLCPVCKRMKYVRPHEPDCIIGKALDKCGYTAKEDNQ